MAYRSTYRGFGRCLRLIGIMCVSACTGAPMEVARIQKSPAATAASSRSCVDKVISKPEFAGLLKKIYLSNESYTTVPSEYLRNESKPTNSEISDLYKLHGEMQECRKIALDGASAMHPLFLATVVEYYSESDRLWAQATSGKLTWGKFNEGRQAVTTQYQAKLADADTVVRGDLQGQDQFEREQRHRAAAAMQQWADQQQLLNQQQQFYQQQQVIAAANRPVVINCNYSGSTAQCNSF